jgi:MFS family permease
MDKTQSLFNAATLVTLTASLLVSAAAFIVMRFYLRAIFRESQRSASPAGDDPRAQQGGASAERSSSGNLEIEVERPQEAGFTAIRSPTFEHAAATFRRAAAVYFLGGSIHAATSVALLSALLPPSFASRSTELACYAGRFWGWSFFTLMALALFYGPDRRIRGFLIAIYIVTLLALGALLQLAGAPAVSWAELANVEPLLKAEADVLFPVAEAVTGTRVSPESVLVSPLTQPILFWARSGAPVVVPVIFFNRFVRGTVGPLFINLALLMVLTTFVFNDLWLHTSVGIRLLVRIKQVLGDDTFAAMTASSLTLAVAIAVLGVLWIARRYRRSELSDQTFLFDALWLSASFCVSVYLMADPRPFYYLLGLVPFALYKLTVGLGLRRLRETSDALPQARLLYLRVLAACRDHSANQRDRHGAR